MGMTYAYGMVDTLLNTFGKRLRVLRTDMNLTQTELTEQLGGLGVRVGQSYLSELERTERLPNGDVVAGLAKLLHTSADYLLLITDDPIPQQESETRFVVDADNRTERELLEGILDAIRDLSPDEQRLALEAVQIVRRASRTRGSGR